MVDCARWAELDAVGFSTSRLRKASRLFLGWLIASAVYSDEAVYDDDDGGEWSQRWRGGGKDNFVRVALMERDRLRKSQARQ